MYIVLAGTPLQPLLSWHPIIQDVYNVSTMPFFVHAVQSMGKVHALWGSPAQPVEIWDTTSTEMGAFVRVFVPDLQQYPDIPYVTYHTLKCQIYYSILCIFVLFLKKN